MVAQSRNVQAAVEQVVIVAILLVLLHTLIQDLGDLLGWSWNVRRALIYIGCGFDFFFSAEFAIRLLCSLRQKRLLHYLRDNRGWIDFVASVPLLIFSSGPAALSAFNNVPTAATVAGVFGVLKIIKAIRIARVLRLLRLLKIFKHIKHIDSHMAQRHITRVATISVATVVLTLVAFGVLSSTLHLPDLENAFEAHTLGALESRLSAGALDDQALLNIAELRPDVLIIQEAGRTIYSRETDVHYRTYYGPSDYTIASFPDHDIEVYIDLLPLLSNAARQDILHFVIIIVLISAILFLYGPHFANTISDPVQVVSRGLREKGHSLQAIISSRYKEDEVFRLADSYNEVFLPLKDRAENNSLIGGSATDLSLDDIKQFTDT